MRSTPRLIASLAVGASLLSVIPQQAGVRAETAPPANTKGETGAVQNGAEGAPLDAGVPKGAITAEELRFIELTNEERVKRGLVPLKPDPVLVQVARQHSAEMRDKAYFSHTSPTSGIKTPMDRYLKAVSRPGYACVGENLFYCSIVDVQRGHAALMNSPTHRENILFPRFERMGVGIVKNAKGEFWVTQMFLTLRDPNLVASKKMSSR